MYCAANWKMNKTPQESQEFFESFLSHVDSEDEDKFIFFPPTINLTTVQRVLNDSKIGWGAQNTYFQAKGAYTGETSPEVVASLGAQYSLVGHSERRSLFKESNEEICEKFFSIINHGMTPMLCIGESLEERESGETLKVLCTQLDMIFSRLEKKQSWILAYEPVWAIGTGKVASPSQAEEVHSEVRKYIGEQLGDDVAESLSMLYGGSVKPANSFDLIKCENIDGFLVGGASLDAKVFLDLFNSSIKNYIGD